MSAEIVKLLAAREGSQAAFARALDAPKALVWQWVSGRRPVSPKFARAIESKYGVSRHVLRPDVFGPASQGGQGNG